MDITAYEPRLKKYYAEGTVPLRSFKKHPTMRLLTKVEDWTGDTYEMPIWVEAGQAIAKDFSTALEGKTTATAAGEGVFKRWSLSRSKLYGFAKLDRLTMKASQGNARAFMSHMTEAIDGTLSVMGRDIASNVFRARRQLRGVVSAVGAGSSTADKCTLTRREDTVNLYVGMRLQFTDTDNSAALLVDSAVNPVIGSIDRSAGTFLVTAGVGGAAFNLTDAGGLVAANLAAGDLIYRRGDVLTASDTLGLAGFEDWIPSAAPSATTFFGVDRTSDTDKLSGIRVSGVGMTFEDALIEASERLFEAESEPTHWICNPVRFGQLHKELGSRMVRDPDATQKLGTEVFIVSTNAGSARLFADRYCQKDIIWGIDEKTWKLVSTGSAPHIFDEDFKMLRESSSDAYEVRMGAYFQLGCHYPGGNCRIDLV